jgi:hypothetical protein
MLDGPVMASDSDGFKLRSTYLQVFDELNRKV